MDEADGEGGDLTLTRIGLRGEGWIGFNDEAVFVDQGDGERIKIRHENVESLSLRTTEWDLAVMSVVLIGVGAYVGATRNVPVGIAFGAIGVWSLFRTYANRYELIIRVEDAPKPVTVHPVNPKECHDMLATATDLETWSRGT